MRTQIVIEKLKCCCPVVALLGVLALASCTGPSPMATAAPTATPTPVPSPTLSPQLTPSAVLTPTLTPTLSATPTPTPVTPAQASPFGVFVLEGPATLRRERWEWLTAEANDLGANWFRMSWNWLWMERAEGQFNWWIADTIVDITEKSGVRLLPVIEGYHPGSALSGAQQPYAQDGPRKLAAYENFLRQVVRRYKGRIRYWQIENEVTIRTYWGGTLDKYLQVLQTAYRAIKSEDPESVVLIAGFAGAPMCAAFYQQAFGLDHMASYKILLERARHHFDVLDMHLYLRPEIMHGIIDWFREQMRTFGYQKPIWVTETGGPDTGLPRYDARCFTSNPPPEAQASEVVKRHVLAFARGAERVFWFYLAQRPDLERVDLEHGGRDYAPMVLIRAKDLEPVGEQTPGFYTYRLMVSKLRGFIAGETLDFGQGVSAYRFSKPASDVYVSGRTRRHH